MTFDPDDTPVVKGTRQVYILFHREIETQTLKGYPGTWLGISRAGTRSFPVLSGGCFLF